MNSPTPSHHRLAELSSDQVRSICRLYDRIWPQTGTSLEERCELLREAWVRDEREVFSVWNDAAPLALAMVFPRSIETGKGLMRVMALAGVCSAPEKRGLGLGVSVVRAALSQVDLGRHGVALFQTGVPGFYEKLGARLVQNTFTNPRHRPGEKGSAEQPWWEPHVMIYPAAFDWPNGSIDLGGPGY